MSNQAYTCSTMYPMQTPGDRLVLAGLRSWIAGLHYEDASCWEAGWTVLSNELDPPVARDIFSALEQLAFALRSGGVSGTVTWPISCRLANRFEVLTLAAISLVQRGLRREARDVFEHLDDTLKQGAALDRLEAALVRLSLVLDDARLAVSCNFSPLDLEQGGMEAGDDPRLRQELTAALRRILN